jgi:hypothetical protein
MLRPTLLWCLAAVAGVVLAAGIAYAASGLARAPIGLASEPLGAGQGLAPKAAPTATPTPKPKPRRKARPKPTRTPTPTPTAVATAVPTVDDHGSAIEPGDDSGGHGGNRGKGGGDD